MPPATSTSCRFVGVHPSLPRRSRPELSEAAALCLPQEDKLILEAPSQQPKSKSKRQRRDTTNEMLELVVKLRDLDLLWNKWGGGVIPEGERCVPPQVKFGHGRWLVGSVYYARKDDIPLAIIIPAVIIPMLLFIAVSVYCYRCGREPSGERCGGFWILTGFVALTGGRVSRRSASTRR